MFTKLVLTVFLFGAQNLVQGSPITYACPFWSCESSLYGPPRDYDDCVKELKAAEKCIQGTNKTTACKMCSTPEYNRFTGGFYLEQRKAKYCYKKQCKINELLMCGMALQNVFMFQDTSQIDGIISCVDGWQPELDPKMCLEGMTMSEIKESDPITLLKQMLTEIKEGCDLVLPIFKCRKHLAPLSVFAFASSGPKENLKVVVEKAVGDTLTCLQTALNKYPCKTIQKSLADNRDNILKQVTKLAKLGGANNNVSADCRAQHGYKQ